MFLYQSGPIDHKHKLQLKFEEIRWVKQALYKQNEIENNPVQWNQSNNFVKLRFLM